MVYKNADGDSFRASINAGGYVVVVIVVLSERIDHVRSRLAPIIRATNRDTVKDILMREGWGRLAPGQ